MRSLKISFPVPPEYRNNVLFDEAQTKVFVRDDAFDRYHWLFRLFKEKGHSLATDDIIGVEEADVVLFNNTTPKERRAQYSGKLAYLLLTEPPVVAPDSYDVARHKAYRRIFTWHDDLVDGEKYVKLNVPQKFPESIDKNPRHMFCAMIVGNKQSSSANELYSKRVETIRWFERNHPAQFDLYGVGWNEFTFRGPLVVRALNRLPVLRKLMFEHFGDRFPSFRGPVKNKREVLRNYRFTICYENSADVKGYISEKIFDAFFAGSVPVYLGANNIGEYIPSECFIDRRDFSNYEDLYAYMARQTDAELSEYRRRIDVYLKSRAARQFRSDYVARVMVDHIVRDATESGLFNE